MELNSALYKSVIVHDRKKPKKNFFRYPLFMFMVNLDELKSLISKSWLIGYNRFNVFSFYDKDHFKRSDKSNKQSTRQKLEQYLLDQDVLEHPQKILLLTHLRIFGYVFNPVSFYYCFDTDNKLLCVVAEVTNTFGEMKLYMVKNKEGRYYRAVHPKEFYISPFTELDDHLDLRIGLPGEKLKIFIDDFSGNDIKVKTILTGHRKAISNLRLIKYLLRFPFLTIQIISLIHWQALKLWLKGVNFHPKDKNLSLQKDLYYTNRNTKNDNILLQKNSPEVVGQNEIG